MGEGQGVFEYLLLIGGSILIAVLVISILTGFAPGSSEQRKISRDELAKQFCPEGYTDDGGAFSWDQFCQGKSITCSYENQKCYYKELQERMK